MFLILSSNSFIVVCLKFSSAPIKLSLRLIKVAEAFFIAFMYLLHLSHLMASKGGCCTYYVRTIPLHIIT